MRYARQESTSTRPPRLTTVAAYGLISARARSYSVAQTERDLQRWEGEGGALGRSVPQSARRYFTVEPDVTFRAAGEISDYAIDAIAVIEMQRQLMVHEAGMEAAREDALCKLHDALSGAERDGTGTPDDAADSEAFAREIERVQTLSYRTGNAPGSGKPEILRLPRPRENAARTPITRPRLRRTQGRGGHH